MADLPAALSSRFCSSAVCLLVPVSSAHVDNPPPDRGNGVEMGSAIEEAGKSVIPFICDNILTCLDGYASPPTYAQCVALGPVTSERIHLDYNAAGPDSKKVKVSVSGLPENYISINKVFLWVRKARQYLNECRSLMASGENVKKPEKVPNAVSVMDGLCDAYEDPTTGMNTCAKIRKDKRCQLDGDMSLHEGIATALGFEAYNVDPTAMEQAHLKLCECSCFSDIVDVYTPIFEMWKKYDPEVATKMSLLQTSTVAGLCTEDVTAFLEATVEENNAAQCGINVITLRFQPNKDLKELTVITVTGLNAHLPDNGLVVVGDGVILQVAKDTDLVPAQCSEWCSRQGLCPSDSSAVDGGCSALPGYIGINGEEQGKDAVGLISSERCLRWCDKDAVLRIVLDAPINSGTKFSISVNLRNPTYEQTPPVVMVAATGPGVFAPMTAAQPRGITSAVLRAANPPQFKTFIASEFDYFSKFFDHIKKVWRGNGPGMLNTLRITVEPNIVLLPGARITLTGLIRGPLANIHSTSSLPPPSVSTAEDIFDDLAVESWDAAQGKLVLRVTSGTPTGIPVGTETIFDLEMLMPAEAGSVSETEPKLKIEATRGGVDLVGQVQPKEAQRVLNVMQPTSREFVKKTVEQTKCWPGECNEVSFSFAVSIALYSSMDVTFEIQGLLGMKKPDHYDNCYDADACGDKNANMLPMFDTATDSNHVNLFQSDGSVAKMTYALWDEAAGVMQFKIARGAKIEPFKDYSFKVHLLNKYVGVESNNIRLEAYMPNDLASCFTGLACSGAKMDGTDLIKVCAPAFLSKSVRQAHPWPGCSVLNDATQLVGDSEKNTITVELRPNVKMMHPATIMITQLLGDVVGMTMKTSTMKTSDTVPTNFKIDFDFVLGDHVVLTLQSSHDMEAGKTYTFVFEFINPRQPQSAPDLGVSAVSHSGLFTIMETKFTKDSSVPIPERTSAGEAAALFVAAPAFVIKKIGQSSPYPDARNTITLTIAANIALYGKDVTILNSDDTTSGTRITISGLSSIVDSTSSLSVAHGSTDLLKSTVNWSKELGQLVFEMDDLKTWNTADNHMEVSVQVTNPSSCTTSPTIRISATAFGTMCPMPIQPQEMDRDDKTIPFATCAACGPSGDRCNSCVACDLPCEDRDAMPLKVHAPAFVTKAISQSTSWPGADNSITVTLRANIKLIPNSHVYIAGFVGSHATTAVIILQQCDIGSSDACSQSPVPSGQFDSMWDNEIHKLTLKSLADIPAGTAIVFKFTLQNPLVGQRAPLITIWATNTGSCEIPVEKCVMDTQSDQTKRPLHVDSPQFVTKDIVQANPYTDSCAAAGRLNLITVTFASNVAMLRPTRVTISGLMGSVTKENYQFKLLSKPDFLEDMAKWSAGTGSLILSFKAGETVEAGVECKLTFELLNPPSAQSAPPISISTAEIAAVRMDSPATDLIAGDQRPLQIVSPKITVLKVHQSSPRPGALNTITVSLRTNAPIQPNRGSSLTISGFQGAQAPTGLISLKSLADNTGIGDVLKSFRSSEDGVPGAGSWCSDSKALAIFFSETLDHTKLYVFSFDILNPTCNQACSPLKALAKGLNCVPEGCGAVSTFTPSEAVEVIQVDLGLRDDCPMKVEAPAFTVKTISECSDIANQTNTLAVSIVPNVDLPRGTVISVVGLVGARLKKGPVPVSGLDAPLFRNPTWMESSSTLKLTVQSETGLKAQNLITFNLAVENPSLQNPVQPSVGADHPDVIIGVSTMSGQVLGAGSTPAIISASITESSTVVRSYNTLMMMMKTNVVVPVGSEVTVKGIVGTESIQGDYEVGGMHPFYFQTKSFAPGQGELVLTVTSAIPAKMHTMIALEVKNANELQAPRACQISVRCPPNSHGCAQTPGGGMGLAEVDMVGRVLSFKTKASFTTKSIGQSNPYPGETNVLTLTLATNLEFRVGDIDAKITITGLKGANATYGDINLGGSHPFTDAVWTGTVLYFRIGADMAADVSYVLTMEIRNPFRSQPAQEVRVTSNELGAADDGPMGFDSLRLLGDVSDPKPGEGGPLFVRTGDFTIARIGQSSPYPCAENVICVTLQPSIPFTVETKTRIAIYPLSNAARSPAGPGMLPVCETLQDARNKKAVPGVDIFKSPVSDELSAGHWNNIAFELDFEVTCRIEAGVPIVLCFNLINPSVPQDASDVYVKSSNLPEPHRLQPDSGQTAHPMFVLLPEFKDAIAVQSTSSPCATNTVTITMSTNVPLMPSCSVSLTVYGLTGTDTDPGTLSITNTELFESTGIFDSLVGTLVLTLAQTTSPGVKIQFSFDVKNRPTAWAGPGISLETSGIAVARKQLIQNVDGISDGSNHPVNIRDPTFNVKRIGSETSWPGATNTLTVTIESNIDLKGSEAAKISITFLTGTEWDAPVTVSEANGQKSGIACDPSSSNVFVMYSLADVRVRFPDQVDDTSATYFVCVRRQSDQWEYFKGGSHWQNFPNVPTDILVATVETVNNKLEVTSLNNTDLVVNGIVKGYKGGDVRFKLNPDAKSGCQNAHPIVVTGDYLIPHGVALTDSRVNPPHGVTNCVTKFEHNSIIGHGEKDSEKFVLTVSKNEVLGSGETCTFSFQVRNGLTPQAVQTVSIEAITSCASIQKSLLEGQPLFIEAAGFRSRFIEQSKPFPCTWNQLTVAVATNVHMKGSEGAKLTVTGLLGAIVDNKVEIFDGSGGGFHNEMFAQSQGDWIPSTSALELAVALDKNLVAGREYRFVFDIYNPSITKDLAYVPTADGQNAVAGYVKSTGGGAVFFLPRQTGSSGTELDVGVSATYANGERISSIMSTEEKSLELCANTVENDRMPLFMYKPDFTVARIDQSSAFPCDTNNIISVTLQTNVPLCAKDCFAQITIENLVGVVHVDMNVALEDVTGDGSDGKNDHLTFAAYPGGPGGHGHWDSTSENLILYLACCMDCGKPYSFSFEIQNPACQAGTAISVAPDVYVRADNDESDVAIGQLRMISASTVLSTGGNSKPLGIIQPVFVKRIIDQNSMAPCATNKISVTLQVNVPLLPGLEITITGLIGAQTTTTTLDIQAQDPSKPCFEHEAKWDRTTGTLTLFVAANMDANMECSLSFELSNPAGHQSGAVPTVHAFVCVTCPVLENTMSGTVMKVSPLNFDSYIWQSSPFPCDENTITVSLAHHDPECTGVLHDSCIAGSIDTQKVPLFEICNPQVTISGLTNAVHNDGLINLVNEASGGPAITGIWSSTDFSVTLELGRLLGVGSSASSFRFSFTVMNPNFASGVPSVTLDASLQDSRQSGAAVMKMSGGFPNAGLKTMLSLDSVGAADFNGKALDDTEECVTVVANAQCVKMADNQNDRRPLFIRPIFFIKKKIGQSNAEPCAHTTVTVTLETSVPMFTRCSPKLTIRGLGETVELAPWLGLTPPVNTTNFTNNHIGFAPNAGGNNPFILDSFHRQNGHMVVSLVSSTMAGLAYTFSFTVRHRASFSVGVDLQISMDYVQTDAKGSLVVAVTDETAFGLVFTGADGDQGVNGVFDMLEGPSEERPMFVKKLRFKSHIGQTSFHPCDQNTIWVKVEAHMLRLYYSCNPTITISGLTGTQTSAGEIHVFYNKSERVPGVWKQDGSLEVELKGMYDTSDDLAYKVNFLFHFTVTNPAQAQNPRVPRIDGELSLLKTGPYFVNGISGVRPEGSSQTAVEGVGPVGVASCPAACSMDAFTSEKWSTTRKSNEFDRNGVNLTSDSPSDSIHSLPVFVKQLTLEVKDVRQTSPYPCDLNEIFVRIATNVKLLQACTPVLTISGLIGSYSVDNDNTVVKNEDATDNSDSSPTFFKSPGAWTQSAGQLVVQLGHDLSPGIPVAMSFMLYNPNQPLADSCKDTRVDGCVTVTAVIRLLAFHVGRPGVTVTVIMANSEHNAPASIYKYSDQPYKGTKEAWPLKIRGLIFETKTIRQSTPHSGCFNTITVTLQTNVPLLPNAVCQPMITMSGLTKANHTAGKIALVAPAGACPVGVNRADIFKSAAGNQGLDEYGVWSVADFGVTVFSAVPTTAGIPYVFSFQVQNPHAGPGSVDIPSGLQEASTVRIQSFHCPVESSLSGQQCANSALPGIPAVVSDMFNVVERPCCLCNVDDEDTGVMRVKAPVFCTKNIGQSSPWPCDMNTLTITITPTTILYGNVTTITISGLMGARAASGPLKIKDESKGQRHDLTFASELQSTGGMVGYGTWDNTTKKLVLHVVENMECNGPYIMSFELQNPDDGQDEQTIMIEANHLHPDRPSSKILGAAMFPDNERIPVASSVQGDSKALRIRDPVFIVRNIVQSSSTPCDMNTISVTLQSTVPLIASCNPMITLQGLMGADTKNEPRRYETVFTNCTIPSCDSDCTFEFTRVETTLGPSNGVLSGTDACEDNGFNERQCNAVGCCEWSSGQSQCISNVGASVCVLTTMCTTGSPVLKGLTIQSVNSLLENVGDWRNGTGTLVLPIVNSINDMQHIVFSFQLRNPSRGQSATTVIAQVMQGIKFNSVGTNTMSTPVLAGGPATNNQVSPLYPLTVDTALWTIKTIGQSSPWPCDENTISISVTSSTRLLDDCSPMLTIKGLVGMDTENSPEFPVADTGSQGLGEWDKGAGRLVVAMRLLQETAGDTSVLSGYASNSMVYVQTHSFAFSFVLRNPAASRPKQLVDIIAAMSNFEDKSVQHAMMATKAASAAAFLQGTSVRLDDMNSWDPNSGEMFPAGVAEGQPGRRTNEDDDYGYIRPISFTNHFIGQKTRGGNLPTDPCSPTTISITLVTSVPFLMACPTYVTISGFKSQAESESTPYFIDVTGATGYPVHTPAGTTPSETTNSYVYVGGSFNTSSGSWIMRINLPTVAGKEYIIEFPMWQRAAKSDGVGTMKVGSSGIAVGTTMTGTAISPGSAHAFPQTLKLGADAAHPLKVNQLAFRRKYISQSSPFPCDDNTLTVSLSVTPDAVYKICSPRITLAGLVGSQTPDLANLAVGWSAETVLGDWTQEDGKLVLALPFENNEASSDTWVLSFNLVNAKAESEPVRPDVEAELTDVYAGRQLLDQASIVTVFPGYSKYLVRDERKYSQESLYCNGSDPLTNGWGHPDIMLAVPTEETGSFDRFLCGQFDAGRTVGEQRLGLDKDRMPLRVRPTRFITKDIGQSSPYPCDVNTITMTLATTVPLLLNAGAGLDCHPKITISGLTGSQTSATNLDLVQNGHDHFDSMSVWTPESALHSTATNVLSLVNNTIGSTTYIISFNVTNRAAPQDAQIVSIEASLETVSKVQMEGDATTSLPLIYGAQAGNSRPMKILAADFIRKRVGQSVPYPGCTNTITMTLAFNVPLFTACPTYIRISGIADEAGSPADAWKSPSLYTSANEVSLIGLQHLEHDGTTWASSTALWWAPGICEDPNDRLGDHHFMERCAPAAVGLSDRQECTDAGSPGWAMQKTTKCGSDMQTRLVMHVAESTAPNVNYVIQFQVENPVREQFSANMFVEGRIGVDATTNQGFQYIGSNHAAGSVASEAAGSVDSCDPLLTDGTHTTAPRHALDKDTTTLLCCTSCSAAQSAVVASSTRSDTLGDGQNTAEGDAEPLKIHKPFFCTKKIGQSSPYPCGHNVLTITIAANTWFSGTGSVITIENLHGAHAPTGLMDLMDGPNKLGHHLFFSAEDWSALGSRTPGSGWWDNALKKLTLYVLKDTDCATEYAFSFQVENPMVQQHSVPVSIKAEWIADTMSTFNTSVGIVSSAMVHDDDTDLSPTIPHAIQGDANALKVWALEFKSTLAEQSTPHPCDFNHIRVSFKTNVPLLKTERCSPTMTLTGLDNAIAPTGFINITQDSWFAATADKFEGYVYLNDTYRGNWTNAGFENLDAGLKILELAIMSSTMADTVYSFNITVRNPAEGQTCPATSIIARGCGDVCTDPATTLPAGCSSPQGGGVQTQQGIPSLVEKSAGDVCAMQITAFLWHTKQVSQSSPFPCDDNMITVELRPNLPVRQDCTPSFTIHGFGSVQGPVAGVMMLRDVDSHEAVGAGSGFGSAAEWNGPGNAGNAGQLVLDLTGPLEMDQTYKFSFKVTNMGNDQNAQIIKITSTMSSTGFGVAGSKDRMVRNEELTTTADSTAELIITERSAAGVPFSAQDKHPLFVRPVQLMMHVISQSTSIPCADNTVTVSLQTNVPLLVTAHPNCQPRITIKGIKETNTADTSELDLSDSSNVTSKKGNWSRSNGELDFDVDGDSVFLAGTVYTFTFVVENPAKGQEASLVETRISGLGTGTRFMSNQFVGASLSPLFVQTASIIEVGATQTSAVPCAESAITITLKMTVKLLPKCHPTLTISGLTNSLSDNTAVANANIFSMVSWSREGGQLVLAASAAIEAHSAISVTFTLRNPNFGQARQPVTIHGNIWNAMNQNWGQYNFSGAAQATDLAPLRVDTLTMRSWVGQSSPYPCDANTLTVTISTNIQLMKVCNPVITVYNLQNAYNPPGNLSLESGSNVNFQAHGVWSSDNRFESEDQRIGTTWTEVLNATFGKFVLAVTADLAAGTNYVFSLKVTNPASPQVSPDVVIELNGIYPGYVDHASVESSRIKQFMEKDLSNSASTYNPCYMNMDENSCDSGSKEGTASPMYIRKAAFEVGQTDSHLAGSTKAADGSADITFDSTSMAGQSSFYPCLLNTITVTVQTNVPLLWKCRPTFTITGLNTDKTVGTELPITNTANVFQTSGIYSVTGSSFATQLPYEVSIEENKGTLVVRVSTASTVAGTAYLLSFPLTNTNRHQHAPSLSISARIGSDVSGSFVIDALELPGDDSDGGKKKPLFVTDNYWTTRKIAQSNPLPCATNSITVSLATSVPLSTACGPIVITIKGIDQTQTPTNAVLAVVDCSNVSEVFASTGKWTQEEGSLEVALIDNTVESQDYCLRFLVKNKAVGSTSMVPTADISGVPLTSLDTAPTAAIIALDDANPAWTEFVCPSDQQNFKIGEIPVSVFNVKIANQSNAFPCHHNTILFELRPNVKLLPGTTINILGLLAKDKVGNSIPTQTVDSNAMTVSGPHASTFDSTGVWNNSLGKLVLQVAPYAHLAACETYFFSIDIINPTDGTAHSTADCAMEEASPGRLFNPATITLEAVDICIAEDTINNDITSSPSHFRATAGDAAPLAVLMPAWVVKNIGQSTPYPYSRNTITVTLQSNVPLVHDCPQRVTIEISGLDDKSTQGAGNWEGFTYNVATSAGPAPTQDVTYLNSTQIEKTFRDDWKNSEAYRQGAGMWPDNSGDLMISPLQSICVNPANDTLSDHEYFQNRAGSTGEPGIATWSSYIDDWMSAGAATRSLTVFPAITTDPEEEYIFSFQIINPVMPQESPVVSIKSSGVCMDKTVMTKDTGKPCCTSCTHTGDAMPGDAAPLRVMDSFFCIKTIHQSTPNPCALNTLTVTIMANVPFRAGRTQVLIDGLTNADFPEGEIQIEDGSMGGNNHVIFANNFSGVPGDGILE